MFASLTILLVTLVTATITTSAAISAQTDLFPSHDDITHAAPIDAFERQWYSTQLNAMGEPTLPDGPGDVYRFLWIRTFHPGIAVRVTCQADSCDMTATMLTGAAGYEPGTIANRVVRRLSPSESTEFHRLLQAVNFWRPEPDAGMRTRVHPDGTMSMGLDGANWVFEGRHLGVYHLWDVFAPTSSGPFAQFRALCLTMVRFAGFDIPASEIY